MPKTDAPSTPKAPKGQKNGQAAAPKQPAAPKPAAKGKKAPPRPIVYPKLDHKFYLRSNENGPITAQLMKDWLGWWSEADEQAKIQAASGAGAKIPKVDFGTNFLLEDADGHKVRCLKNLSNRDLRPKGYERLAQDILNRRWSDSINTPPGTPEGLERTINGEAIIIGRHGSAISVQHRGVALVLADQLWHKSDHWKALWPEPPTIEGSVVFGVSEDNATVGTIDNTIPRDGEDVIFTSGLFAEADRGERKIMSKMLNWAVKMLWIRTGADEDAFTPHRTNSEILDFVNRHPHLTDAVRHIRDLDKPRETEAGQDKDKGGRVAIVLSPGYASAMLYLMGCSATDGARNGKGQVAAYADAEPMPNEGGTGKRAILDWSRWDQAREFWRLLATGDKSVQALRHATRPRLGETRGKPNDGFMFAAKDAGDLDEKLAILCKGWGLYVQGKKLTDKALALDYARVYLPPEPADVDHDEDYDAKESGEPADDDVLTELELKDKGLKAGGIDLGDPDGREKPPDVVEGQADEDATPDQGALNPVKPKAKPKAPAEPPPQLPPAPANSTGFLEELAALREAHPGRILIFKGPSNCMTWGPDADVAEELLTGIKTSKIEGLDLKRAQFPPDGLEVAKAKLLEAGHVLAIVTPVPPPAGAPQGTPASKRVDYVGGDETVTEAEEPAVEEEEEEGDEPAADEGAEPVDEGDGEPTEEPADEE